MNKANIKIEIMKTYPLRLLQVLTYFKFSFIKFKTEVKKSDGNHSRFILSHETS